LYQREIEIPAGVTAEVTNMKVRITGPKGSLEREFTGMFGVRIERVNSKIRVTAETARRRAKAAVGTVIAHIRNMTVGVTQGFTYKLKVVFSHFPIKVAVEADRVLIHNFLGEKTPRIAHIVKGVEVKVAGPDITIEGMDKEAVGEMASRLERATRISKRDLRRFMDGIFLISKSPY
jgi:large subunit ribosomal protein L6